MIFVTTGTQEPFDRFLRALDIIAPELGGEEIVAQANIKAYTPTRFAVTRTMSPTQFADTVRRARLVVAHAGMGTIISALQADVPLVVYPRKVEFGEHRNDHQMATARRLEEMGWVYVAHDNDQLRQLLLATDLRPLHHLGDTASPQLVDYLKSLLDA